MAFPLGIFARGRRDWAIEELMLGSVSSLGTVSPMRSSLNNTSKTGRYLAVYAILAWRPAFPQTMIAGLVASTESGGVPVSAPLVPGGVIIEGALSILGDSSVSKPAEGVTIMADGRSWVTLGDLPMFIIPPSSRLSVSPRLFNGTRPVPEPVAVTFLWGYYRGSSKVPRARRSTAS